MKVAWPIFRPWNRETIDTTIAAEDFSSVRTYWILIILISVLLCLPVWFTAYTPLADYPNHLARTYIAYHYNDVETYRFMYDRVVEPIPNMAIDLVVPPLLKLFDIRAASKIFLTTTLLLFILGCHLLGRAIHGRPTWLALPCAFFSYNSMLFWGFVNYIFGLGMFLMTLAIWLQCRRKWDLKAVVTVTLLVFASYLSHLSAYVFLGVTLAIITFFDCFSAKSNLKTLAVGLLPLLPPLIAFRVFMNKSGQTGEIVWSTGWGKLSNAVAWLVSYNYFLDCVLASVLLATLLITALYAKGLQVKWAMLVAGGSFGVLFLACPLIIFTSWAADVRFMPPAAILTLLALRFQTPKRIGQYALVLVLAVLVIRLGGVWYDWSKIDRKIAAQVEMFNYIEDGAKVYPIIFSSKIKEENKNERPLRHIIHYSTIYRHTFSPTLFALRGQQPLVFKNQPELVQLKPEIPPDEADWGNIFGDYDYLWCYKIDDGYARFLRERCELIADSNDCMIFRINKPVG